MTSKFENLQNLYLVEMYLLEICESAINNFVMLDPKLEMCQPNLNVYLFCIKKKPCNQINKVIKIDHECYSIKCDIVLSNTKIQDDQ